MSERDHNWRWWTAKEWNEAIFAHFFLRQTNDEDRPVHRIPVTGDELVKIVSEPEANAQEVQEVFLNVVRTPSHTEFNRRLSRYHIDPTTGWKHATIPPFLFELAFSCLVASPPDEEIRDVGDFRNRLARLLHHDRNAARYPLDMLASLWRAFSTWLDGRRSAGAPYRRLELPPLDHRTLIGYSINLAFPSRKDLIALTQVLAKARFEGPPPIPTVFYLVGSDIDRFSASFRKAYEEFRDAFGKKERNLERFPFWGAVREAMKSAQEEEEDENGTNRAMKLVLESNGVVLLLSTMPGNVVDSELTFVEADTPYRDFGNILCVGGALTSTSYHEAIQELLHGRHRKVLANVKGGAAIGVAIEQGILLFKKSETLSWELVFTRPEEGDLQALG